MVLEYVGTQKRANCIYYLISTTPFVLYFDRFRFSRSGLVLSVERTASISFPKTFLDGEAW